MKYFDLLPNRRIRIGCGNKAKIINVDGFLTITAALLGALSFPLIFYYFVILGMVLGGTL